MSSDTAVDTGAGAYRRAACRAWREWGGEADRIELESRSENVVFRVDSHSESFVLRMHRPGYHDLEELISEQVWTEALNAAGIGAPAPVVARDGRRYVEVDVPEVGERRWVGVSRWREGRLLQDLVQAAGDDEVVPLFVELGQIAARIHDQAVDFDLPRGFRRPAFDVDGFLGERPFWGRFWDVERLDPAERGLFGAARLRLREQLLDYGRDRETYSLIHADLHPGNVLVVDGGLHVIDFDDAGFGWHQYELAVALFNCQSESRFPRLRDGLVEGYRSVRSISDDALDLVPVFVLLRALALVGWIDARPELERADLFNLVRCLARRQIVELFPEL